MENLIDKALKELMIETLLELEKRPIVIFSVILVQL